MAPEHEDPKEKLRIFVNRRKFDEEAGVRERMTGAQIAALVNVPVENATVKYDTGPDRSEIAANESITIKMGDHFLVTRNVVEGGHGA